MALFTGEPLCLSVRKWECGIRKDQKQENEDTQEVSHTT